MYSWIWRKLPFGFWGKLTGSAGLLAATVALLWFVVFPLATPLLPFDDVQVTGTSQDTGNTGNPDSVDPSNPDEGPDDIPYSTESNAPHPSATATPKKTKSPAATTIPGD